MIYLRTQLLLPLNDLLAAHRASHESLCADRLAASPKPDGEHKPFKAYEPGYVHVDVKYLPQIQDEDQCRYVFVVIGRATRWVFIAVKQYKSAASARAFLAALHRAAPFKIRTILTDNGKEFTDRSFGSRSHNPQESMNSTSYAKHWD